MTDKKLIAAIVKKLERAIGILDNCCETGEISEATRRRVVEMLNAATMDVYFVNKPNVGLNKELAENEELPNVRVAAEPTIEVEEFREQLKEIVLAPNVHGEPSFSAMHDIVEEIEHQHELSANTSHLDEDKLMEEITAAFNAPIAQEEGQKEEELPGAVSAELDPAVTALVEEPSITAPTYQEQEDVAVQEEKEQPANEDVVSTASDSTPPAEKVPSEVNVEEPQKTAPVEPLLELELSPINIADTGKEKQGEGSTGLATEEDPNIALERKQLESLRLQLELERSRLEAELQNWQTEKMKRDEEMRAAEKLLAALAAEELRRKTLLEQKSEKQEVPPIQESQPSYQIPVQKENRPPVQETVAVAPAPPVQPPAEKTAGKEQVSLIDKFLGSNKKFLHDNFEIDDLRTQGLTPIADLTKAIGINDKFQFIKELFGGDSDLYAETIKILNSSKSLDEVITYVETQFSWDKNNDAVKRLILLLRRRYM